jgi:hydrogenase nickel incorporation protein HypB
MCVVCGCSAPPAVSTPARSVRLETDILSANNRFAEANRARFASQDVVAYNLMSSPGSGKTTLLCATLRALQAQAPGRPLAVIEGDQQTRLDADRIRATGTPAVQINTGHGCHLDARMVGEAYDRLGAPGPQALLFIENVGNLVCPALWDLGERAKVVVLSVTEGDDKPLKYPDMFAAAALLVINKIDLLPHVDFDVARCIDHALRINPQLQVLLTSATRGDGMEAWLEWVMDTPPEALTRSPQGAERGRGSVPADGSSPREEPALASAGAACQGTGAAGSLGSAWFCLVHALQVALWIADMKPPNTLTRSPQEATPVDWQSRIPEVRSARPGSCIAGGALDP